MITYVLKKTEGYIVKISNELIAIKSSIGIIIKKDSDITNVYSIDKLKGDETGGMEDTGAAIAIDEQSISRDLSAEENEKLQTEESSVEIINKVSTHETVATVASVVNITTESSTNETFETAKPQVKVVAKDLLEKIKARLATMDHSFDKQETRASVIINIRDVLWKELPESYSDESINYYRDAVYNYVNQHYGSVA